MIRGDTKVFSFKVKKKGITPTEYVDGSTFTEVEVQFNSQSTFNAVKKLKSKNEVSWDSTNSCFVCQLTQQDTFTLNSGDVKVQVRLYVNNDCKATLMTSIDVGEVLSQEVLK